MFQVLLACGFGLVVLFVCTAPWVAGGRSLGRLTIALVPLCGFLCASLLFRPWREYLIAASERPASVRTVAIVLGIGAFLFSLRVVLSQYNALMVNAWDFSVFELPVQRTFAEGFLHSPFDHRSFLGTHASYVLALLVPFYALLPTHYWLLLLQALAISLAVGAGTIALARVTRDSVSGGLLAIAFLLNSYTAKALQYVFHVEILYPVAIFLLVLTLNRAKKLPVIVAGLFLLSIKEDAILVASGIALALVFTRPRRWRLAVLLLALAASSYLISTILVMPRASGSLPGHAWYSAMWSAYGPSPMAAALGMVTHPHTVASDLTHSGVRHLFEPLLFTPVVGWPWLLAAIPGMLVYGVSDGGTSPLAQFALYYSVPVLPLLFLACAAGIRRIARSRWLAGTYRDRVRLLAFLVCIACALDGPSYIFRAANPRRHDVKDVLKRAGDSEVRVQGSLLPHASYEKNVAPLVSLSQAPGCSLIDLSSNPYPFSRAALQEFVEECARNEKCEISRSVHGLLLMRRRP